VQGAGKRVELKKLFLWESTGWSSFDGPVFSYVYNIFGIFLKIPLAFLKMFVILVIEQTKMFEKMTTAGQSVWFTNLD
jgi:hypothetical protein